jgi:uncharacterized protein with FMN-binding domain
MIPKRAISALVTTVFALALLFSFKTPDVPDLATSNPGTAIVGVPDPSTAAVPGPTTAPVQDAPTAQPTPDAVAGAYRDGTVTGALISTRFGNVQVEVVISGGELTDVVPVALPSGDRRSVRISEVAAPILREEALTAQDAQIDLLSGATYTSDAYARSLQSALDQVRA